LKSGYPVFALFFGVPVSRSRQKPSGILAVFCGFADNAMPEPSSSLISASHGNIPYVYHIGTFHINLDLYTREICMLFM
jgi:hypothetical protein